MKELTFKRGIHPPENKLTSKNPITVVLPETGEELIYPMLQHIGAPCVPLVKVGDRVLVGQKIADSEAFVSSPIHASVSGIVKDIRPALTAAGSVVTSVVVENDGEMKELETINVFDSEEVIAGYSKEKLLAIIHEAGVVGLGGAGFPAHIKLNPPTGKKIDYIIVNASECEPFLTTDHRVLVEEAHRLKRGLCVILQMFPEASGIIGIETNKPDAIACMTEACKSYDRIRVIPLKPKYPQGSEKQLIYSCTKREVPSGGLPADVGCIVNNVDTVIAIDRAVHRGRPLMRKIVTLTGGAVRNPGNYKIRIGMTLKNLVKATGGLLSEPKKMIAGGPMMGVALFTDDVPTVKTSSAFLMFTEKEAFMPEEQNCIRCGKCVAHCPMNLLPFDLNYYVVNRKFDLFTQNNGMDCIECGSCSYVCPSKRHLAQSIRATRRNILEQRKKS